MCGTLKNVVALAAGFVDGLGYGPNSKAAILRQGLSEMMNFSQALYPTIRDDTFMESCGMADLVRIMKYPQPCVLSQTPVLQLSSDFLCSRARPFCASASPEPSPQLPFDPDLPGCHLLWRP